MMAGWECAHREDMTTCSVCGSGTNQSMTALCRECPLPNEQVAARALLTHVECLARDWVPRALVRRSKYHHTPGYLKRWGSM